MGESSQKDECRYPMFTARKDVRAQPTAKESSEYRRRQCTGKTRPKGRVFEVR